MTPDPPPHRPEESSVPRKAGLLQVASTLFWGLCMIGKKNTWEKDGATVTPLQLVIGGIVAATIIICTLLTIAYVAVRK